jgi:hypothetical protein
MPPPSTPGCTSRRARPADAVQVLVEDDGAGLPAQAGAGKHPLRPEHHARAARRIGGTLEVGPRPGGGTVVRLIFPLAVSPRRQLTGAALMAAPRIVLVDDHALCRNGLSDLLRLRGGMDVLAALSDPTN